MLSLANNHLLAAFMTKLDVRDRNALPTIEFALQAHRKEPLEDASHVCSRVAGFNQVIKVSNTERDLAWRRILRSAKKYGAEVHDTTWRDLGRTACSNQTIVTLNLSIERNLLTTHR